MKKFPFRITTSPRRYKQSNTGPWRWSLMQTTVFQLTFGQLGAWRLNLQLESICSIPIKLNSWRWRKTTWALFGNYWMAFLHTCFRKGRCIKNTSMIQVSRYLTLSSFSKLNISGNFKHISTDKMRIWKLEDVLVEKYKFKRVDAILFAGFIQSLIEPDPELRATASSALLHSWMMENN